MIKTVANKVFSLFICLTIIGSSFAFAGLDKTTEKARLAVQNAAPHDWHTLAKSADKCIQKGVNMTEAFNWLETSLSISETAFNNQVMGDYYYANQLPEKALEHYSKAMQLAFEDNEQEIMADVQVKIADIRNITLGEH